MTYKKRLIFLLSLIGVLLLTYMLSLLFSSDFTGTRTSSYVWLDSRAAARVTRIVINAEEQDFELVKKTNQWFVLHNGLEFPARQVRVEDFLSILTTRSLWPVRSSGDSSHERFGLTDSASRVTIYGEYSVLLDLLLGNDDIFRNETYFRKYGHSEVRSGDNSIKVYLSGQVTNWYNLRLIPESEGNNFDISNVQRLTVNNGTETQSFNRRNRSWEISGITVNNPSMNNIENYIRSIINLEGDNFVDSVSRDDPVFDNSRITIELGNGRVITIRFSEADETGRVMAHVSGRDYVYTVPAWSASRIFRDASNFETN
ncbi:MAG: DUF4340 domain-containing protein [Treponema sp.]|nr:DUF4340 domain-containing protein [Treponema sp.]